MLVRWIVSIPVTYEGSAAEEKGRVRGKYVAVERLRELESGETEWIMATESTPGGSIPPFLSEASMNSQVADDVPHFFEWLKKQSS
jgi:hypothetical protein